MYTKNIKKKLKGETAKFNLNSWIITEKTDAIHMMKFTQKMVAWLASQLYGGSLGISEAYSWSYQTSMMRRFNENSWWLKAVN